MAWDDPKCPICHHEFHSSLCGHSVGEVNEFHRKEKQKKELEGFIRKIVREELKAAGLVK